MSLAKKLSALPAGRQGKSWLDTLTPAQRAEAEAARAQYWARDSKRGVSAIRLAELIIAEFGLAVTRKTVHEWIGKGKPAEGGK